MRLTRALRPARTAADLDEELRFHLERRAEDLIASGIPREEALRTARRQLGNPLATREISHEIRSAVWLEAMFRDFRFGLRMLSKYRAASVAAIASLALAIGACTAAFSLIDALTLRPLPVRDPAELVDLARVFPPFMSPENQPREFDSFSYPEFQLLRGAAADSADLFLYQYMAGYHPAVFDDSGGASENIRPVPIDGRGFDILGVKPALGRLIQPDDDSIRDGHMVAVLSYAFWKRRFAGSPSAIGRTVTFDGFTYQIVGVAEPSFTGLHPGYLVDLWTPFSTHAAARLFAEDVDLAPIWARIHPGVNRTALRDRLQAAFTNHLRERVHVNPPRNMQGEKLAQYAAQPLLLRDASRGGGRDSLFRAQFREPFLVLGLICALLLLVACSNVANLMLARASSRDAEMALRISLGAPRRRLIQQLLIESGQIAVVATILAVIFAALAAPVIVARLGPSEFPAFLDVSPGARSIAFAAALSLLSTLLFGLTPALEASAARPEAALKSPGHSARSAALGWMLAAQVGFSVAILFLSGLLLLSFRKLIAVDTGFDARNVILFDLAPRDRLIRSPEAGPKLLEKIRALPGVASASLTAQRPMGGDMVWIMTPFIRFSGRAKETIHPTEIQVSGGFFNAMRIRWIAGRDFLPEEFARPTDSVIVNQAFAGTFFGGGNPIGETFEAIGDRGDPVRHQIVGVCGTIRYNNLREPDRPTFYAPLTDASRAVLNVRAATSSATMLGWLRREVESAAPTLTVRASILLESQISNTLLRERLLALLAGFFSVVALLLAAVGLYGVIHYAAVRRTREIGIRIALGARRASVVRLVVGRISIPVTLGIAVGIAGGIALARYLVSQLFGVKPTDFASLAAPIACILFTAVAAALPPALRAAAADPLIALRHD